MPGRGSMRTLLHRITTGMRPPWSLDLSTSQPGNGLFTRRVEHLRQGEDPRLLARMPGGWAVLGDRQPNDITGCCMLIPDPVVSSVNELDPGARAAFMNDLVNLGDAVLTATGAERVNYLILGNQVPELHGHVIPRFASEDPARRRQGPFEAYDFGAATPSEPLGVHADLVRLLRSTLAD